MEIKEVTKYRVSFYMDEKAEGIVDKYIPYASYYRGHSIICDSEDLAVEYVKHIAKKLISAEIYVPYTGGSHVIDRIVNTHSKEVNDFTTCSKVNYVGLEGNRYDFDIRSDYYDGKCYQSLLNIEIIPHRLTMVND
jgi:hypothetical protein